MEGITPNFNLKGNIQSSKILSDGFEPMRLEALDETDGAGFKEVFKGLVENLNTQANAPDEVMNQAMLGQADIHDVMAAIQKADIEVNLATTVVGKVIQAYEKISQISI